MRLNPLGASFLSLYLSVGAIHIIGCYRENWHIKAYSKPFLMPLLLASYLATMQERASLLIIIALICDTAGDVLLMFRDRHGIRFLLMGMLCFIGGHVGYSIWLFSSHDTFVIAIPWTIGCVVAASLSLWFRNTMIKSGHRYHNILSAYALFIDALIVGALYTWGSGNLIGTLLCLAGALLFCLSDFLIAMETIGRKIGDKTSVMITYIFAQLLFISGFVLLS